jgi:glycine dehydrogenase subunit 1
MLEVIGAASLDDLFRQVPASLRASGRIDLPGALSEPQVRRRLEALAAQNLSTSSLCFAGAGAYPHQVPEVVNALLLRGEFATAYTPYQPEVSQGTLQATFEFQSLVAMLFGLDVANASMYDAASAAAEAVLMARRIVPGRAGIWVSRAVHPHVRRVIRTYTAGLETAYRELPIDADGRTDLTPLTGDGAGRASCVVLGYPNVFGVLDDVPAAATLLRAQGGVLITVTTEPLALGVCQAPGALGADIAVGEGQSLGLPMSYGGPGVGLFAIRERHVRHMPGRVVGATIDRDGRRGYVLTLATREQHIRRERATSNICTNQTLCAVGVAIYLSLLGRRGLRDLADLNYRRAHAAAARLERVGFSLRFAGPFFNEFVVQVPEAETRWKRAAERGILAGVPLAPWYPELGNCLLVAVTEMHAPEDVERLAVALETGV